MEMINGKGRVEARPEWTALETWVRGKVQGLLHDAVLESVRYDWKDQYCVVGLLAFLEDGRDAQACQARFYGATEVVISCKQPWGPSIYVNEQSKRSGSTFVIEMQSGDELRITAQRASLVPK